MHAALQSGDACTARWLLMRVAGDAASSDHGGLANALLARLDPPSGEQTDTLPLPGSVALSGGMIAGRVDDPAAACAIDVEVDGRFFRIDLPAAVAPGSDARARQFRLRPPVDARVIRVASGDRSLDGSPLVLRHDPEPLASPSGSHHPARAWIIVPVHGAADEVRRCLDSVLTARNRVAGPVLVVDDASPDPALRRWLDGRASTGKITLLRRPINGGFVAAVNTGLRHVGATDVVLLNSDTVVTDGWLDRLHAAAHGAPDIGAVNPLSNNAELLSLPRAMTAGPMPDLALQRRIDRRLAALHAGRVIDIPAGVGFCWYLRGDALASVGLLDEAMIGSGYGEDTEFSIRLRNAGWRLVAALDTFVAHAGTKSFGAARQRLASRNVAVIGHRFPEHGADYRGFLERNPLASLSRDLQRALLAQGAAAGRTLLLTDEVCRHRRRRFSTQPAWSLTPHWRDGRLDCVRLEADAIPGVARVDYAWPAQRAELLDDLETAGFGALSRETFADWTPDLIAALGSVSAPRTARLVDASAYCPRRHASHQPRAHCEEPAAVADCEACIVRNGPMQRGVGPLVIWREAVREALAQAATVQAVSPELARRLEARLGMRVAPFVSGHAAAARRPLTARRIAFIGITDSGSGFALVSDLARMIDRAGGAQRLVIVGRSFDDRRLARHECVELPGEADAGMLEAMMKRLDCDAIADPALNGDAHVTDLATRAGLPLLRRADLLAMLADLEGSTG